MQINEIFSSIEGEGIRSGYPATFIRTFGCNLNCSYCDTMYCVNPEKIGETKEENCKNLTLEEILLKCKKLKNKRITLTGGEPLIQKEAVELVKNLLNNGYEINIETNGAVDINLFETELKNTLKNHQLLNSLFYTLDYKCPTSNMEDKMLLENIPYLKEKDVLKFVVSSIIDLNKTKEIIEKYNPKSNIFISPVFNQIKGNKIVDFILKNNLQQVRIQAQLHKIFWEADARGV